MRDAVKRSKRTLLVMTPNWVSSEWTKYESILVRTKDPAGLKQRTIPLLLERCKIPDDISILTHVDFTRPDRLDLAWRQLLTALGTPPEPPQVIQPAREQWLLAHPYPMPPHFTGRAAERAMLTNWLTGDAAHPLLVLRALGGFGKSALTWHWLLHDVDPSQWPRVVWWSFYESDSGFESFLAKTVGYLTGTVPQSPREHLAALLRALHARGTLLVLDGFERALRAFGSLDAAYRGDESLGADGGERDCLSPLAEMFLRGLATLPGMRGKVLLTTRLRPAPVEARGGILLQGCREEELTRLRPDDAVELFRAEGIRGSRAEIEEACEPYGHHPLSLRLLAGLIVGDLQQPGDVAAARRLDVSGNLIQRRHHVLQHAYDSLGPDRRKLLSGIACFRSPVPYDALAALAESGDGELDGDLQDLLTRGLLHRDPRTNRFDLHPIVRRYAYDRLAGPDRGGTHARLRDYFAAVPAPEKVRSLEDLGPVIELYHHTVRAGQYDEAHTLFRDRLRDAIYYQLGAYQLVIDLLLALFPEGEHRPPRLGSEDDQGWTLNELANAYSLSGQPRRAVTLFEQANKISEELGEQANLAVGLRNLADDQLKVGAIESAEGNLRRAIALSQELKEEFKQAIGHRILGRLLAYRGAWDDSQTELATALEMAGDRLQTQGVIWSHRALRELLWLRSAMAGTDRKPEAADVESAVAAARRALELAEEVAREIFPFERDYVRAHWLLGAAHLVSGDLNGAEQNLHEALARCRRINMVDHEADILIDLARLRLATSAPDEAERLADEALVIAERSGYVLQGADAHLVLAEIAQKRNDRDAARRHAREALKLATCDGPPDYTYKAAYDEATAMLTALG